MQVHVVRMGNGPRPVMGQTCILTYKGYLPSGSLFDSSPPDYKFELGQNIIGLEEALMQLSVGSKAKIWIPYDKAYGEDGAPPMIPARADLTFDLSLDGIQ